MTAGEYGAGALVPPRRISVRFRKWDGTPHWQFDPLWLGEDDYGQWLVLPRGSMLRRGHEQPVIEDYGFVTVIPHEGWWTALWNRRPRGIDVYVDITAGSEWSGDTVSMIDLDLDVIRDSGGSVEIDDEDEFLEHQTSMGYPASVIDRARATAAKLAVAVESHTEPFGSIGEAWRAQVEGAGSWLPATVVGGHGAASGVGGDSRFPGGTIAVQTPTFASRGLDLSMYHNGTINLSVPGLLTPLRPIHTFPDVEWMPDYPAETFSFMSARIRHEWKEHEALVYWPHPETKPEHHQAAGTVEILAPHIASLQPGHQVHLWIDPRQASIS